MTLSAFLAISLVPLAATLVGAAPRKELPLDKGWTFRQAARDSWYPATVPGSVHLDLLQNGLVGDPFYRENEKSQQWIGKTDWEYRLELDVPADILGRRHVDLVFEGLDTYARVFLNGKKVLDADNMYRRWRVPAAGLKPRGNELRVELRSPITEALPHLAKVGYVLPAVNDTGEKTSPYTRKAPYQYGWDWGPRLVTCGIWKPVRLEAWDDARIVDVFVRQRELQQDVARLTADVEVLAAKPAAAGAAPHASLTVEVEGGGSPVTVDVPLKEGASLHEVDFEIRQPRLWWPNGLGEQHLYRVTARLVEAGQAIDEAKTRVGLRTLELRRQADQWGKSFEFVVNGVPVFAKGANWIPADSFPTRVTRERYESLLRSARDAHMNMLRVWGGGLYESDDFYDIADEMGLLLWQDFHFSCSLYPADQAFLENVKVEVEEAVRRLRNHPSLALWNGNNEIEAGWFQWGWKESLPGWLWDDYQKLFHDAVPKVVARFDPTRAYWPSSPSANREADPGSSDNGDMHYWGVWHGRAPFSDYEKQVTRFMSEYGFQSFPEMRTIRAFAKGEDMGLETPVMLSHQKSPNGNQLIREYMLRDYPPPRDFASFLYLSQVLQAEGVKVSAEHLRRMRPRAMGSLYWQLDDCWPVASWSSIDYYGRWKALHYYARRFYDDLLVSLDQEEDANEVGVHVTSDRTTTVKASLRVVLLDLAGGVLWERREDLEIAPLASQRALVVPKATLIAGRDPRQVFLRAELLVDGRVVSSNNRFFAAMKELALGKPAITAETSAVDGGFRIVLSTNTLARHVRLAFDADEGVFSDEFFDLVPGEPVEVTYKPAGTVDLAAFHEGLAITSLVDAFAAR
jgi:beta-mannosidase